MAADMDNEEEKPRAATQSSRTRVPWHTQPSSGSKWQSSFGVPLAHTSLRAYLSPRREKKLRAAVPVEALQRQYYNESIKFSYIQGLFDSCELNQHAHLERRCQPQIDNVKDVMRDNFCENLQSETPRQCRRTVDGFNSTKSSVDHSIIAHGDHQKPATECPPVVEPRNLRVHVSPGCEKVSCKIGARPGQKDKILKRLFPARWKDKQGDVSAWTQTYSPAELCRPHMSSPPSNSETKQAVQPNSHSPHKQRQFMRSAMGLPSAADAASIRTQASPVPVDVEEESMPSTAALVRAFQKYPAREEPQILQLGSRPQSKAEVRVDGQLSATPRLPSNQCTPRKRREAAYMPLVSPKPKMMDLVETTLFGAGLKGLTLESRAR